MAQVTFEVKYANTVSPAITGQQELELYRSLRDLLAVANISMFEYNPQANGTFTCVFNFVDGRSFTVEGQVTTGAQNTTKTLLFYPPAGQEECAPSEKESLQLALVTSMQAASAYSLMKVRYQKV